MPRFGIGFDDNDDYYSSPLAASKTPLRRKPTSGGGLLMSPSVAVSSSPTAALRLCCMSPDGKQWHSVNRNKYGKYVLRSRVVEESGDLVQRPPRLVPSCLETLLPEAVQESLAVDPPKEIFCVEAEGNELVRLRLRLNDQRIGLPHLCVYSSKAVFVIQTAFDPEAASSAMSQGEDAAMGQTISVVEPFEEYFLRNSYATTIVRVRPAPQRWMGHAVHSPAGCLAMLTEDRANNEYRLCCLESNGKVKDPAFQFGLEQVLGSNEKVVDFCFAQSNGLSLLSSLSVLLLKGSGYVMAASPFMFNGTLVPRPVLEETMTYLQVELEKLDRSQPKWRQCRAAQQYLIDVFPQTDRRSLFVTAKTYSAFNKTETAAAWTVKLQGPILFKMEEEDSSDLLALTIENFGNSDLVGFAICSQEGNVDIGITSPTSLIPRFGLESQNDAFALDDEIFKCSAWVDRFALGLDASEPGSISLYRDPNFESVMHVVTRTLVASISSDSVRRASLLVRQGRPGSHQPCSAAWSCLEQTSNLNSVQGVVACPDSISGHKLLIQLTNGSIETVNVTQEKASHELQSVIATKPAVLALLEAPKDHLSQQRVDKSSSMSESTRPFYEIVSPQIEKVNKGLSSMGKIVGSETRYDEITPEMLAVVATIQERCEQEVALPVLELAKMIKTRREALSTVLDRQAAQIAKLMETRKEMEERSKRIRDALATAEANARNLKERANAALQASKDLAPTVTNAEVEYFRFVDQMDAKTKKWEKNVEELRGRISQHCEAADGETISSSMMDSEMALDLQRINSDTGRRIINTRQTLKETEQRLRAVLRKAGFEAQSENIPSNISDI